MAAIGIKSSIIGSLWVICWADLKKKCNFAADFIKERTIMNVTMPLENIYKMLSTLSVGNKKWLADHLYADIMQSQETRTKEQLALDMEMSLLEAKEFKDGHKTLKSVDALINEL